MTGESPTRRGLLASTPLSHVRGQTGPVRCRAYVGRLYCLLSWLMTAFNGLKMLPAQRRSAQSTVGWEWVHSGWSRSETGVVNVALAENVIRAGQAAWWYSLRMPVLVENSVTGSGLDFHAAGLYSLSSPPRHCRRRILSIRAGRGFVFGSSSGARKRIPLPWWLRPVL
jgi:hypothetical protein